jgi:nucleoside-diphosphate-sugar epimerase
MIDNCLTVGCKEKSTVLYLGRAFKYGIQKNITEDSEATPNSHQGKVLKKIEAQIEEAGTTNLVKTRIVCHSYPFGENVGDGMLDTNFRDMIKKSWLGSSGKFEWIARGDVSLQITYTPDLARFIIDYAHNEDITALNFHRINFEGIRIPSINTLGKKYAEKAGVEGDYSLSLYSHAGLSLASWLRPEATRAKDVYYAFEKELMLDGTLRRSLFKDYEMTSLDEAVSNTYQWYNNHK